MLLVQGPLMCTTRSLGAVRVRALLVFLRVLHLCIQGLLLMCQAWTVRHLSRCSPDMIA